jgi:hypothetical protein
MEYLILGYEEVYSDIRTYGALRFIGYKMVISIPAIGAREIFTTSLDIEEISKEIDKVISKQTTIDALTEQLNIYRSSI